jgi:hypothetical protein
LPSMYFGEWWLVGRHPHSHLQHQALNEAVELGSLREALLEVPGCFSWLIITFITVAPPSMLSPGSPGISVRGKGKAGQVQCPFPVGLLRAFHGPTCSLSQTQPFHSQSLSPALAPKHRAEI